MKDRTASVSVVIPCYRSAGTIERAIGSVAAQSLGVLEVLAVDDCSGDETISVLERLATELPKGWLRVITLPTNSGPSAARNIGWEAARGDFVAFLDADDSWHVDKVQRQYSWMNAHPEIALTGHGIRALREGESPPRVRPTSNGAKEVSLARLVFGNCFGTATVMVRRQVAGRFDTQMRRCEDYRLWLEVCCSGDRVALFEEILAYWHKPPFGAGGLSQDLWAMQRGERHALHCAFASGRLSRVHRLAAGMWSEIKFIRRLILSSLRKS